MKIDGNEEWEICYGQMQRKGKLLKYKQTPPQKKTEKVTKTNDTNNEKINILHKSVTSHSTSHKTGSVYNSD